MSIIIWIMLGLIAGFTGSRVANRQGQGVLVDMLVGVAGALFGGLTFNLVGSTEVTGLSLWSIVIAVSGAVVFLVGYYNFWLLRRT